MPWMGGLFGWLGHALGSHSGIANWSLYLRGGAGFLMVLIGLQMLISSFRMGLLDGFGAAFWKKLSPLALVLQSKQGLDRKFALGLLWGWLPCGLVYSILAFAAVSGGPINGAGVMIFFGLGTLPSMLGVSLLAGKVDFLRQQRWKKAAGFVLILGGLWMAAMPVLHLFSDHGSHHHMH